MLARGTKIFVVPGEHDFSSFQVENVHWKCMCAFSFYNSSWFFL